MEYEVNEQSLTVYLEGELDHHTLRTVSRELAEKLDLLLPKQLVLDMRRVRFMDSSGIALVIKALRRMDELAGSVTLRAVPPAPLRILTMAGVERHIRIEEGETAV